MGYQRAVSGSNLLRDTPLSARRGIVNRLFDILLSGPLPEEWIRGLLFTTFSFHIFFVLMTIGTAILALFYFLQTWWLNRPDEAKWGKTILRYFLVHKSLAVVLGVAPLLLIQVGFSVPFFNSIGIFVTYWMLIIVFLIVAFLLFDSLGHKIYVHRYLHLFLGIIALITLLIVPAIFVLILVTAENPDYWGSIIRSGYRLNGILAVHWFLRYLHVIGAAIVFGAAFHYFFSVRDDGRKRLSMSKWMMAGILFQFIEGPALAFLLPHKFDVIALIFLTAAILSAAYIVWRLFAASNAGTVLHLRFIAPLLIFTLLSMLLIRQHFQDLSFVPLEQKVKQNSDAYIQLLSPYQSEAIGHYMHDIKLVYNNGPTIYSQSCSFCHGNDGNGKGPEAGNLSIPPEDISAIRTTNEYIYDKIVKGIPGTSMPYFAIFDKEKLQKLINYLNVRFHVLALPENVPVSIPKSALNKAAAIYKDTCSVCHGADGRGSESSKSFQPPPPDFTKFTLSPSRAFEVTADGYPGTAMPSFQNLHKDVRWGLVKIIYEKRGLRDQTDK
jgi:mono/diheme cytochrome c family protein